MRNLIVCYYQYWPGWWEGQIPVSTFGSMGLFLWWKKNTDSSRWKGLNTVNVSLIDQLIFLNNGAILEDQHQFCGWQVGYSVVIRVRSDLVNVLYVVRCISITVATSFICGVFFVYFSTGVVVDKGWIQLAMSLSVWFFNVSSIGHATWWMLTCDTKIFILLFIRLCPSTLNNSEYLL